MSDSPGAAAMTGVAGDGGPEVVHAPGALRWEARADGVLVGVLEYRLDPGRIVFTHTGVEPAYRNRGIADALVRAALDDSRGGGRSVVPRCPYVAAWIRRHPDYAGLVA